MRNIVALEIFVRIFVTIACIIVAVVICETFDKCYVE